LTGSAKCYPDSKSVEKKKKRPEWTYRAPMELKIGMDYTKYRSGKNIA